MELYVDPDLIILLAKRSESPYFGITCSPIQGHIKQLTCIPIDATFHTRGTSQLDIKAL